MQIRKQRGFAQIVMLLITLSVISYLLIYWEQNSQVYRITAAAKPFYKQLEYVKQQVDSFQIDRISAGWSPNSSATFPSSWSELQPSYLPSCSTSDNNAGRCRKPEQTPWGSVMQFHRINAGSISNPRWRVRIRIPLPPDNNATRLEHLAYFELFSRFPGSLYNSSRNEIEVWIDRVDSGLQQEALVKRSGDDSTLTGDWDIGGNFSITNAKGVYVRNSDGSQRRLGSGVLDSFTAHHGERVNKHRCPSGLTPDIQVSIKGIYNLGSPTLFENVSSTRAYIDESSTYWTVNLDYYANVNGTSTELHDGEINVQVLCVFN